MATAILVFFALIGIIFIMACTVAPKMKKQADAKESNASTEEEKTDFLPPLQESPVTAVFVCKHEDGSIVLPTGESLSFVRKDVTKEAMVVYLPQRSSDYPKVEIPVYRLRSEEEPINPDTDRVVESILWITPNLMLGRILDGEKRAIVRCSKEDFLKKSFRHNVSKTVDCGYGYEEFHYDAPVVSVREERVLVPVVYLKE